MTDNIGLLYPIYLDVAMTVSFVATLEGGYSLENVRRLTQDSSKDLAGQIEGEVGLPDTGLFNVLSNFVKADLKGTGSIEGKTTKTDDSQIVLKHTEASLFMRLRHELRKQGRIICLDEVDRNQWKLIKPSQPSELVELSGYLEQSPINQMIQIGERIAPFILATLPQKDGNFDTSNMSSDQLNSLATVLVIQTLRSDLASSPITDMVLRYNGDWNKSAVLDLSTKVLPLEEQERLLCGRVVVLGKVTRVLDTNEKISLFRRSVLYYTPENEREQMIAEFNKVVKLHVQSAPAVVEFPAVEIVPMAIYI